MAMSAVARGQARLPQDSVVLLLRLAISSMIGGALGVFVRGRQRPEESRTCNPTLIITISMSVVMRSALLDHLPTDGAGPRQKGEGMRSPIVMYPFVLLLCSCGYSTDFTVR